jgi:hypothetical protein
MGASPDGYISCSCHGDGVIEIKCPYRCISGKSFHDRAAEDSSFCLSVAEIDSLHLNKSHVYYCQVQQQMKICKVKYCDFMVW